MSVHSSSILHSGPNRYERVLVAHWRCGHQALPATLVEHYDLVVEIPLHETRAYVTKDGASDWSYAITLAEAARIARARNAETVTVELRHPKVARIT